VINDQKKYKIKFEYNHFFKIDAKIYSTYGELVKKSKRKIELGKGIVLVDWNNRRYDNEKSVEIILERTSRFAKYMMKFISVSFDEVIDENTLLKLRFGTVLVIRNVMEALEYRIDVKTKSI
jgi:hypothetical protein